MHNERRSSFLCLDMPCVQIESIHDFNIKIHDFNINIERDFVPEDRGLLVKNRLHFLSNPLSPSYGAVYFSVRCIPSSCRPTNFTATTMPKHILTKSLRAEHLLRLRIRGPIPSDQCQCGRVAWKILSNKFLLRISRVVGRKKNGALTIMCVSKLKEMAWRCIWLIAVAPQLLLDFHTLGCALCFPHFLLDWGI
jgi:hypothetical protein